MSDIYEDVTSAQNSEGNQLGPLTLTESTQISVSEYNASPCPILNLKSDVNLFDVDPCTGFMPPSVPLLRLPPKWETWEVLLDDAIAARLQLGDSLGITNEDTERAEYWRSCVRQVSLHF